MKKYRQILAAVDLAENCEKVVSQAHEMAQMFDAQLALIHVVEPLPGYGYAFIAPNDIESELVQEAKKQLHQIGAKFNIEDSNIFVEMGPAKAEVIEKAKQIAADLIVVGTHSHNFIGVLGSTANAIIHSANCDVLTFKVDEEA